MAISIAFNSFKVIKDILNVLQGIEKQYDNLEMKVQVVDLKDAFLTLKDECLDIKEVVNEQRAEITRLEEEISKLINGDGCKKCEKGNLKFSHNRTNISLEEKGYVMCIYRCNNNECNHYETKRQSIIK